MHRDVGQPGVHRVRQRMAAHELLDHAILEGMETDHGEAAVRRQARERRIESGAKLLELAVYMNAQGLKYPRGRMLVAPAAVRLPAVGHPHDHFGRSEE